MQYDQILDVAWPIASGSGEGARKDLIKDRMERSGMRWTPAIAEAMVRLRATHLTRDFEAYWEYRVPQHQTCLYRKGNGASSEIRKTSFGTLVRYPAAPSTTGPTPLNMCSSARS